MSIHSTFGAMSLNKFNDVLPRLSINNIESSLGGLSTPQLNFNNLGYSGTLTLKELAKFIFKSCKEEIEVLNNKKISLKEKKIQFLKQQEFAGEIVIKFKMVEIKVCSIWASQIFSKVGILFSKKDVFDAGAMLDDKVKNAYTVELKKIQQQEVEIEKKEAEKRKAEREQQEIAEKIRRKNAHKQDNLKKTKSSDWEDNKHQEYYENIFRLFGGGGHTTRKNSTTSQDPFNFIFVDFVNNDGFTQNYTFRSSNYKQQPSGFVFNDFFNFNTNYSIPDNPPASTQYNPYEVMEVPKNATNSEIKKSYHKLALKLHPDKNKDNPQATAKFQLLNDAYSLLKDPTKRAEYDRDGIIR